MTSMQMKLQKIEDPEALRHICLELLSLMERQKQVFKQMMLSYPMGGL